MPTLDLSGFELEAIEDWPASDSRQLLFTVTVDGSTPKDITNDTIAWYLTDKAYEERSDAIVTGDDPGVEIRRDTVVDPTAGEFRVDIDEGTLAGEWGAYQQHVVVDPADESRQSYRGRVTLTAAGGTP